MSSRSFRVGRSLTGLGLFATKPIKRRATIATYRGRRMTPEEADRLEARGSRYMFQVNKRVTIDGSPRWNVARYINHSCRPNAEPVGRNGGIVIVALRRIEPGEEITYDYGKEYLEYFLEEGGCRCDSLPAQAGRQAPQEAASGAEAKLGRVIINSDRWTTVGQFLLCRRKRTLHCAAPTVALGLKRTHTPQQTATLFNHLVGACE